MNAAVPEAHDRPPERYVLPSSFAQQRLWFLSELEATGSAWHVRLPLRLTGPLDSAALEQAFAGLVARHETLRTTLELRDGEIVQVVASRGVIPLERVDCSGADEAGLRATLGALGEAPFDLAAGPLLRVHLVRLAPADHVLLVVCHHCISDAWSSGVLFRDLAALYATAATGEPLTLPALPIQYADYAAWQRDWLAGEALERQLAYWRRQLAGAPALITLPGDWPRPAQQGYRGDRLSLALPAALTDELRRLARAEGVTLFMLLFAAFNVVLGRWSGHADLVIGTPIAGRGRSELEDLIGCFVNTLALRIRLAGCTTFRDLLPEVRRVALEAFEHQDLPFEKLVEALNPPRNRTHSPLFQVLFSLQNAPWEATGFGAARVLPAEIAAASGSKFDLSVSAVEYDGQLWLGLEYNTDLYAADTVRRFGAGFEALLGAVVADPASRLDALPVQAPADRRRVLVDFNPASAPLTVGSDLYALFDRQARATPGALAAACDAGELSYAELVERAGQLAARLQAAGATPATPVAILLPRSLDMLVAVLAVLRTGGHYLPLDPRHPPGRLEYILSDAGATLLVATPDSAARLPAFAGRVLPPRAGPGDSPAPLPPPAAVPGDTPAYLIYTSGSTGRPKGVCVSRRAVLNFLVSMAREPGLAAGDRLLAVTTLAFDIAVLELLLPLTVGAATVIATDDEVRDPAALCALLDDARITVMQATPAAFRNLLAAGFRGRADLRLLCGGEALDAALAAALLPRCAELWNLYGPTETTVWSCCDRVMAADAPVCIGRPIANTRCYVLDESGEPVPAGVAGALWIAGDGVALGYHRQPGLTAARFRPDPFAGGRMYATGDRARWRGDGRLEWLGRADFQLKLRGFRIEPGEIEGALRAVPGISDAVVVLREIGGDPRLVAFLVAANDADRPSPASELARVLPDYMVPAHFIWLPALPLTPNGKIDRAALPAVELQSAQPAVTIPRNPAERLVGDLFAELLGTPGVDMHADFFALGGHSLLVTRLLARVRDRTGVAVPLQHFFRAPTVAGLAEALTGAPDAVPAREVPPPAPAGPDAPLSLVQQRLWFLDQLEPGSAAYNLAFAWRLSGAPDVPALNEALAALTARHAILRTCFVAVDGVPVQRVLAGAAPAVRWMDGAEVARGGGVAAVLGQLATAAFDLAAAPLWRVTLCDEGSAERGPVLSVVLHHLIADGWSLAVFNRELAALYRSALRGGHAALEPLPLQYADYAQAQRAALDGGILERQLQYWRTQLGNLPAWTELPVDRPRPSRLSPRGARLTRLLGPDLRDRLQAFARAEGCTLFTVLLTGFNLLLARHAGTEDVVVGTPVAGRGRTELEGLIGFFVNTLVLRTDLRGNPTGRELLGRVRRVTQDAFAHADVPFEQLVEVLQPVRNPARTPLFQVLFNLHSEPAQSLVLDGLRAEPVAVERRTAKFELAFSLAETAAGIPLTIEYQTDLFLPESIERLAADYGALLDAFVTAPERHLTALPFSPAAPGAAPPGPATPMAVLRVGGEGTLPDAFAAVLAGGGDRLAVSAPGSDAAGGADWSYAALAGRASALARVLAGRGVVRGDRIGLWFTHGAGQVAALLGVLEAGAAFVPLDPGSPPARLAAIARDAGLRTVVSDAGALAVAGRWPADNGLDIVLLPEGDGHGDRVVSAARPDSLAYLLYTSGSTGAPKAVAQTHRNVLRQVRAWARNLALAPPDRLSLFSTCAYDAAVQDIFGALLSGAAVCPLDVRRLDRETLLDRVAGRGLTVLHATPTVYRYLFGGHVACRQDLSRVRLVVLGGEEARRADFELFKSRFRPGTRLVNGYGLTEATAVLQWFGAHDSHPYGQTLPIGRPVGAQRVLLLDEQGEPAAICGEIVVESAAVSPGYWPLTGPEAADRRRLHTGDLARYLPDGSLAFVGRRDARVKVGGVRVEPGEIEAALRAHPAVGSAAVVAREEQPGEVALVAFVAGPEGGDPPAAAALRAHLRGLLPPAFLPARILVRATLPCLPNGKPDRQALRALADREAVSGPGSGEPAGATTDTVPDGISATLLAIWRGLPGLEQAGLDDDFFALGGHSLLATRLVARVRDRLHVELPLIQVFEAPTVRGLAARIAALAARGPVHGGHRAPALRAVGRENPAPPADAPGANPDGRPRR